MIESFIPIEGSDAAGWLDACKAKLRAVAAARPRTTYIDRMIDDDVARDVTNFWDGTHARDSVVRLFERDIGAALRPTD